MAGVGDYWNVESLRGKVVIVTGATRGIGRAICQKLFDAGSRVIMGCHSASEGEIVAAEMNENRTLKSGRLDVLKLDLADLRTVRAFVTNFQAKGLPLDYLILNAACLKPAEFTADGFETMFQTNVLANHLIIKMFLDFLRRTPRTRVVFVGCESHRYAGKLPNLDVLPTHNFEAGDAVNVYRWTKLLNIFQAAELARRLDGSGTTVVTVAPGGARTELKRHLPWYVGLGQSLVDLVLDGSPESAAEHVLQAAAHPMFDRHNGAYINQGEIEAVAEQAQRVGDQQYLWSMMDRLLQSWWDGGRGADTSPIYASGSLRDRGMTRSSSKNALASLFGSAKDGVRALMPKEYKPAPPGLALGIASPQAADAARDTTPSSRRSRSRDPTPTRGDVMTRDAKPQQESRFKGLFKTTSYQAPASQYTHNENAYAQPYYQAPAPAPAPAPAYSPAYDSSYSEPGLKRRHSFTHATSRAVDKVGEKIEKGMHGLMRTLSREFGIDDFKKSREKHKQREEERKLRELSGRELPDPNRQPYRVTPDVRNGFAGTPSAGSLFRSVSDSITDAAAVVGSKITYRAPQPGYREHGLNLPARQPVPTRVSAGDNSSMMPRPPPQPVHVNSAEERASLSQSHTAAFRNDVRQQQSAQYTSGQYSARERERERDGRTSAHETGSSYRGLTASYF